MRAPPSCFCRHRGKPALALGSVKGKCGNSLLCKRERGRPLCARRARDFFRPKPAYIRLANICSYYGIQETASRPAEGAVSRMHSTHRPTVAGNPPGPRPSRRSPPFAGYPHPCALRRQKYINVFSLSDNSSAKPAAEPTRKLSIMMYSRTKTQKARHRKRCPARYFANGGDEGIRTPGLCLAKAALSQLSHIPTCNAKVIVPVRQTPVNAQHTFKKPDGTTRSH